MECQVLSLRHSPRSNRRQMQVELLEQRWCPDGSKSAPQLVYNVDSMNDPDVTISGQVYGNSCQNATVQFSGAVSYTVTTDSAGNFSFTAPANYLGTITGIACDGEGTLSNPVENQVGSCRPEFADFSAFEGYNHVWTFWGHVDSEYLVGNVISFQGAPDLDGRTVTTDANGDFTLTVWLPNLNPNSTYGITATAYDCWWLSDTAYTVI